MDHKSFESIEILSFYLWWMENSETLPFGYQCTRMSIQFFAFFVFAKVFRFPCLILISYFMTANKAVVLYLIWGWFSGTIYGWYGKDSIIFNDKRNIKRNDEDAVSWIHDIWLNENEAKVEKDGLWHGIYARLHVHQRQTPNNQMFYHQSFWLIKYPVNTEWYHYIVSSIFSSKLVFNVQWGTNSNFFDFIFSTFFLSINLL